MPQNCSCCDQHFWLFSAFVFSFLSDKVKFMAWGSSLLSWSCKPSGLSSHRDADAAHALFARPQVPFFVARRSGGTSACFWFHSAKRNQRCETIHRCFILSPNKLSLLHRDLINQLYNSTPPPSSLFALWNVFWVFQRSSFRYTSIQSVTSWVNGDCSVLRRMIAL